MRKCNFRGIVDMWNFVISVANMPEKKVMFQCNVSFGIRIRYTHLLIHFNLVSKSTTVIRHFRIFKYVFFIRIMYVRVPKYPLIFSSLWSDRGEGLYFTRLKWFWKQKVVSKNNNQTPKRHKWNECIARYEFVWNFLIDWSCILKNFNIVSNLMNF